MGTFGNLRSIAEMQTDKIKIGDKFRMAWYFETPLDKLLLFAMVCLSLYAIARITLMGFW